MNKKMYYVKFAYSLGIIADTISAFQLIKLRYFDIPVDVKSILSSNSISLVYGIDIGADLMIGWTALMIWAVLKPVERRGILLLTACPVMVTLVGSRLMGILMDNSLFNSSFPSMIAQLILGIIFFTAFLAARGMEKK